MNKQQASKLSPGTVLRAARRRDLKWKGARFVVVHESGVRSIPIRDLRGRTATVNAVLCRTSPDLPDPKLGYPGHSGYQGRDLLAWAPTRTRHERHERHEEDVLDFYDFERDDSFWVSVAELHAPDFGLLPESEAVPIHAAEAAALDKAEAARRASEARTNEALRTIKACGDRPGGRRVLLRTLADLPDDVITGLVISHREFSWQTVPLRVDLGPSAVWALADALGEARPEAATEGTGQ